MLLVQQTSHVAKETTLPPKNMAPVGLWECGRALGRSISTEGTPVSGAMSAGGSFP